MIDLLVRTLRGDPDKAPRSPSPLLELLVELLAEVDTPLEDVKARDYLANLKAGGKAARLVKQLLSTSSS